MYLYFYKMTVITNNLDEKITKGIICAESYFNACRKLVEGWGEDRISNMFVECITDDDGEYEFGKNESDYLMRLIKS